MSVLRTNVTNFIKSYRDFVDSRILSFKTSNSKALLLYADRYLKKSVRNRMSSESSPDLYDFRFYSGEKSTSQWGKINVRGRLVWEHRTDVFELRFVSISAKLCLAYPLDSYAIILSPI